MVNATFKTLLTSLLVVSTLFAGCELIGPSTKETLGIIPFVTLDESGYFLVSERGTVIFHNQHLWSAFWDEHTGGLMHDGMWMPAPRIDFSRKMVVGIFWQPRGGCDGRVEVVESVEGLDGEVRIQLGPLPDLGPCRAVVRPQQVIAFQRTYRPVVFTGNFPE